MTAILVDSIPARPDAEDSAAFVVGRGYRKSGGPVSLVINPIIYAEVSIGYSRIEDLRRRCRRMLDREAIPYEAAFLAGKCFLAYSATRGDERYRFRTFYRRPRGGCRVPAADPRCCALS